MNIYSITFQTYRGTEIILMYTIKYATYMEKNKTLSNFKETHKNTESFHDLENHSSVRKFIG